MKATASPIVGSVPPERLTTVPLPISAWDESAFAVSVGGVAVGRPQWEVPDWEDIEAVGAADDPLRFKIGFLTAGTSATG